MTQPIVFYHEQAAKCGQAAAEATLANERDKFLSAQAAWQALADAGVRSQEAAARREAERNPA